MDNPADGACFQSGEKYRIDERRDHLNGTALRRARHRRNHLPNSSRGMDP